MCALDLFSMMLLISTMCSMSIFSPFFFYRLRLLGNISCLIVVTLTFLASCICCLCVEYVRIVLGSFHSCIFWHLGVVYFQNLHYLFFFLSSLLMQFYNITSWSSLVTSRRAPLI
uniref:Uncharacterized protein n=1 Tax=Cacopsylla melanoneura TaxID=428564 RepID=A0A8D8VTQ8_9HEMI